MKQLTDYLIDNPEEPLLRRFAHLGNSDFLSDKLTELTELAEYENWTSSQSKVQNNILYNYIIHLFNRAFELGEDYLIINDTKDYAAFNTGLLTDNGEDIICLFNSITYDTNPFKWHLKGFKKESDREVMKNFPKSPLVPYFFSNPSDAYFDPTKELIKNIDHILDDNFERFSPNLQQLGKPTILAYLQISLDLTIKKCKRNHRIAIPQYYRNKITYLLPVRIGNELMAVAVESINCRYRVNTILTLEMAYNNARLLMKPEVDWIATATTSSSGNVNTTKWMG